MHRGRWWLALWYALATLLAQGLHVHERRAVALEAGSSVGCDEARPHVGDHPVDDESSPTTCPACHFRGQSPLVGLAPRLEVGPGLAIPPAADSPSPVAGIPIRKRCRAPPRG